MSKIVIVGGGVAGLTAGIYARMNGYEAVIYEKHNIPGGNLTGWSRGLYHIDNCVHWLTGTNPVTHEHRIWTDTGALGGVDIIRQDALYTFEQNGKTLSLSRDVNRLHRDMLTLSPQDMKQIDSFIKAINAAKTLLGISAKNNDKICSSPELIASLPILMKYHQLTTHELSLRFHHPVIRGFIRCLFPRYFGALGLLVALATFCSDNGGVPAGGSLQMARRMAERFRSLGGELHGGRSVREVQIYGNRAVSVRLDDGCIVPADEVILAVDPKIAFGSMLDDIYMPEWLKKLYDDPEVRRFSSFHCAYACDMPQLPFHGDRIIEIPSELPEPMRYRYLILRGYSHEPDFAPEGKSLLQTMHYLSEEQCRHFISLKEDPGAYHRHKENIERGIAEMIAIHFPELKGKLRCIDTWSPATYRRFTGADVGSYMGFVFPPKRNPMFMNGRIKGLVNVQLATQWQQAPGGLPVAAKAGEAAIKAINKRHKG